MNANTPRLIAALALASLATGCTPRASEQQPSTNRVVVDDALVQFSLVSALATGEYDGDWRLRRLLHSGDFGVGTFNRLDGEMIVLDGQIFQARADGTVQTPDLNATTPFAAVTYFQEDGRIADFSAATLSELDAELDRQLPRRNLPYAIRLDGQFVSLTLRSVPAQTPPFKPLVEVSRQEVIWRHRNLRGTLVGLRCPAWIGTLNVAGYHWHFVSDDRKVAGHVLACEIREGLLRYDACSGLVIELSESSAFDRFDPGTVDQQAIDQVERNRPNTSGPKGL